MDVRKIPNLIDMFLNQVENRGEKPFLWHKVNDKYRPTTWREVAAKVTEMARALRALGVENGERIVIVSENRPEWAIAELAIIAAGGIAVPAYTTNTVDDHLHILEDSESLGVIISTAKLAEKVFSAAHLSKSTKFAITIEPVDIKQSLDVEIMTWDAAVKRSKHEQLNPIEEAKKIKRTDTACIIYTSG
ncbi:MAG: AMP-binding protein, partial [Rhodospirillaceae bacterium]|nr:AMP-binding protein [Rhodospirillaceae bacterium]